MSHAAINLPLPTGTALRRRAILSCAIGNFFELFDFVLYGFLAVPISHAFFPQGNDALALINTLFFSLALGLGVSAFVRDYSRGLASTLGLLALFGAGLPALATLGSGATGYWAWDAVAWVSSCQTFPWMIDV